MIIFTRLLICKRNHFLENFGTLIICGGAAALIFDPSSEKEARFETNIVKGDVIAIISAAFFAALLITNDIMKDFAHGFLIMAMCTILILPPFIAIYAIEMNFDSKIWSFDPEYGVFGFFHPDNLVVSFLLVAPIT